MNESVATWMAVLERIEQSLAGTLARTPEVPPVPRDAAPSDEGPLERLDQRFEQWHACLERVEREAAAAEGALDADQAAVRAWLTATTAARQRLAERA